MGEGGQAVLTTEKGAGQGRGGAVPQGELGVGRGLGESEGALGAWRPVGRTVRSGGGHPQAGEQESIWRAAGVQDRRSRPGQKPPAVGWGRRGGERGFP